MDSTRTEGKAGVDFEDGFPYGPFKDIESKCLGISTCVIRFVRISNDLLADATEESTSGVGAFSVGASVVDLS